MKRMLEGPDGWCKWIAPQMRGYRLGCCDCGLVHDVNFEVVKVMKTSPDGSWTHKVLDPQKYRVLMVARRNNRSTAGMRRKKP